MAPSSAVSANELPVGVSEADLVEGPKVAHLPTGRATFLAQSDPPATPAALVQPIPQAPAPLHADVRPDPVLVPVSGAQAKKDYPAVIEAALDVLSARLLGLIALVTACLIWAGVVFDPTLWRVVAASGFSISVFWPMAAIYWRAGMTGQGG